MCKIINSEMAGSEQVSELEFEIEAHEEFGRKLSLKFVGRSDELEKIEKYLGSESKRLFVVCGVSGSGKSALMAKAAEMALESQKPEDEMIILLRFIGTTSASSDIHLMLYSLCQEVYRTFNFESIRRAQHNRVNRQLYKGEISHFKGNVLRLVIDSQFEIPLDPGKLVRTFQSFIDKVPKGKRLAIFWMRLIN